MTQTILSLYEEGHKLTEISALVGEEYWKVCKLFRDAIAWLRKRLSN